MLRQVKKIRILTTFSGQIWREGTADGGKLQVIPRGKQDSDPTLRRNCLESPPPCLLKVCLEWMERSPFEF